MSSTSSADEYPVRLGNAQAGEGSIVWLPDHTPPKYAFERISLEIQFLNHLLTDDDTSAADKEKAKLALKKRSRAGPLRQALDDLVKATLVEGTVESLQDRRKEADILSPAATGIMDTVDTAYRKEYLLASANQTYGGPSSSRGENSLRVILGAANAIITKYDLSPQAAFSLVRPSFKEDALDLLTLYEASQYKWEAFFRLIQVINQSSSSTASLVSKLQDLIHTRPGNKSLGLIVAQVINLHRSISKQLPKSERVISFESGCRQSLQQLVLLWWPQSLEAVTSRYAAMQLQLNREVDALKGQGKFDEAQDKMHSWCPVSAFSEAMVSILHALEPAQHANKSFVGSQGDVAPKHAKVHHVAVDGAVGGTPADDLELGADASSVQRWDFHAMAAAVADVKQKLEDFEKSSSLVSKQTKKGKKQKQQQQEIFNFVDYDAQRDRPPNPPPRRPPPPPRQGGQGGQRGNHYCTRCGRHPTFGQDGSRLPCHRYPHLAPGEQRAVCAHCGHTHFSENCNAHLALREIYPEGVRPDRPPPARNFFFSNEREQPNRRQSQAPPPASQGRGGSSGNYQPRGFGDGGRSYNGAQNGFRGQGQNQGRGQNWRNDSYRQPPRRQY